MKLYMETDHKHSYKFRMDNRAEVQQSRHEILYKYVPYKNRLYDFYQEFRVYVRLFDV